jgi:hypothetical protein
MGEKIEKKVPPIDEIAKLFGWLKEEYDEQIIRRIRMNSFF